MDILEVLNTAEKSTLKYANTMNGHSSSGHTAENNIDDSNELLVADNNTGKDVSMVMKGQHLSDGQQHLSMQQNGIDAIHLVQHHLHLNQHYNCHLNYHLNQYQQQHQRQHQHQHHKTNGYM